jgi:hypothetical protein
MNEDRIQAAAAADRLPTLTEVVELGQREGGAALEVEPPAAPSPIDSDRLVARVCGELERHIDVLFEARLREALAPALARAADGLIHDARHDLALAVRQLVEDAVARALQSHLPP